MMCHTNDTLLLLLHKCSKQNFHGWRYHQTNSKADTTLYPRMWLNRSRTLRMTLLIIFLFLRKGSNKGKIQKQYLEFNVINIRISFNKCDVMASGLYLALLTGRMHQALVLITRLTGSQIRKYFRMHFDEVHPPDLMHVFSRPVNSLFFRIVSKSHGRGTEH